MCIRPPLIHANTDMEGTAAVHVAGRDATKR
jgi:hypothetical protein